MDKKQPSAKTADARQKKPYQKPKLSLYGRITDLTLGPAGSKPDGMSGSFQA
jgi:hypothetical protein